MHWTRVSLFCLGAALLASSNPALAQVVNEQTGVVQLEDYSGSMSLSNDGGSWMQVDRMNGDGVGFQNGYTRVGIRTKLLDFGQAHVFTELNGTMNDHGRLGTNLGLGWRTMYDGGVLGIHGWYDNYESNYGHNYQQAVVGAEYLHEWLDLRANGYMPFGDRDNFIGVIDTGTELAFQGHDFGTVGRAQVERSLSGFDAEAGVPLPVATFLKLFAGTYYLNDNKDDSTWGVRSRLEARIGEGATLNFMVTDDDQFGTNLNLGTTIWYGGGPTSPFRFQRDRSGFSRRYDPVRRNQPVQLAQDRDESIFVPLVNTDTGNEFNITWVDNTSVAPGDGTFENPFTQLPGTAPGSDYILVRRGVGNTVGNIVLEDNQHLFGEGRIYTLNTDRLGTVEIPDQFFDQTGPRPTLVPAVPNVAIVTLANNNEVINFNMTGGTAPGIQGAFVNDFRIEHVQIDSQIGIFISDASGTGLLNNIDVPSIGALQTGILIRNQGGDQLDLTMTDITTSGGDSGVQLQALGGRIFADINGLAINDTAATGLILQQFNSVLDVDLRNAVVNSNNDGVLVDSLLGETHVDLTNVTVTGVGDLVNVVGQSTTITIDGQNVVASNSAAGSGINIDVNATTGDFLFNNLTASNNGDDGFRLNAENVSNVNAAIIDSDVSFNGDNNFDVTTSGGSTVVFFVDPTSATDSGAEAFSFVATGAGTSLTSTFIDVDLARAGQSAISGIVSDGAFSRLNLTNVQASDSGLHGLTVNVIDNSDFEAFITNSTFARSGQRGVNLFADNNSNILFNMDGTPANNNGAEGLHYQALTGADGGSSIVGVVNNGNFSDNPVNNIFGQVTGLGSSANWTFNNTTADLLAASGAVELASTAGGVQDIIWTGATSSISQSTGDGVNLTADGAGSVLNFAFSDGRINSNGQQGIDALASNGGAIQVDLTNAVATLNIDENVRGAAQTGGSVFVNATGSDLSNAGLDNVLLTATNANSIVGGIFDGVNLDDSALNGLNAEVTNGGSLDLQFLSSDPLNPSSASNNLNGSGLRVFGNNADSITVASSGGSVISDNGFDNVEVDVTTANVASIQIAGLMDRSLGGDGIHVNYNGVLSGGIDIGPGSANDNFDDGVDITVTNSNLDQGISVSNMTVTGNGGDPIRVVTTGSTIVGGSIDGNTTSGGTNGISWFSDSGTVDVNITGNAVTNATDNGILVDLSGTAVGNLVNVDFNTVTGDGVAPLNGIRLNVRDAADLTTGSISGNSVTAAANYGILTDVSGTGEVASLTIDGNIVTASGIDGILYNGTGGTTLGNLVLSDNSSDFNGGNGLNVQLDNVEGDPVVEFRGNLVASNAGNGILMTAVDTSLTGVDFLANNAATNGGDGIRIDLSSPSGTDTILLVNGLNNTAVGNVGAGINVLMDGFASAPDVNLEGNTATNNGAEGLALDISNMNAGFLTIADSTFDDNGADGLRVSLTNNSTDSLSVVRNLMNNNALNGFNYDADSAALGDLVVADNIGVVLPGASVLATITGRHWEITNTTADPAVLIDSVQYDVGPTGLTFATTRGTGFPLTLFSSEVAIGLQTINGIPVVGGGQQTGAVTDGVTTLDLVFTDFDNADSPLHFDILIADAAAAADHTTAQAAGTNFTANMSNGAVLSGAFDASGVLSLVQAATGTGMAGNGLAGILIGLDNGSSIGTMSIDGNDVLNNGTNGIQFNVTNASTLPAAGSASISNNTISGHENGDGINIVTPDTGGTDFGIDFDSNTITDNAGGSGVNLTLNSGSGVVTTTFTNNEISGNGASGINASLTETADLQVTNFEGNTLVGNPEMGVRIRAEDTTNVLLDGSLGGNTFDGNSSAAIGAILSDSSTGDIRIANSTITNTGAGALANFAGQGVRVLVEENAQLLGTSLIDGNTITGNAGNGVDLLVRDFATIGGMTINDNTINNSGTNAVRIERQESGSVGQALDRLEISGNIITGQSEGVFLIAANTNSSDFYEMNDNEITGMTGSGVHLEVRADADMDVNMDNNLLSNNGLDGILITEQVNDPSDSRSVTGVWTNNEITNNGRHGINLAGTTAGLIIGDIFAPGFPPPLADGNLISGNANDGISITSAGSVAIVGNMITDNGSNGADDAGIDFSGSTFNQVLILNNAIVNNNGDGIEYEGDGTFGSIANISGNNISFNDGRGLDLLVQPSGTGSSSVDMTFNDNVVSNNQLEGVYVIFTASRNQTQDVDSTTALLADGNFTDTPELRMAMDGNFITANGNASNFSSTGLVVRVGTTEASQSTTDNGGFASNGAGVFLNSGVIMDVTNNSLGGNFGDDVYFDSFTSTNPPPVSAGTWGTTDDPTVITTYRADPLARLDLTFSGNGFDSVDLTNVGAFYDTNETVFKSRVNNANAPNQGPFPAGSSDRRRNAQRLASRYSTNPPGLDPNTDAVPDSYLYPGMGDSTFRVRGTQTGLFALDNPALVGDPTVVDAIFEANGILRAGSVFGELPYGWGTF